MSCVGKIGTPGQVQRHSGFEWLCKHNRLRTEPIRFVRPDSEHTQSDGKSHSRPQSHDHSDLRQGSRALAGPDFLSMCRVIVSYSQPIRFGRFDGKSVNRGLPVLDKARALISAAGQKDRGSGKSVNRELPELDLTRGCDPRR